MKNSEASTQDTERFQLPEKIKKELRETLVNLKIILKDNLNFFHELVKKCTSTSLGKSCSTLLLSNISVT